MLTDDHQRNLAREHRQLKELALAREADQAIEMLTEHIDRAPSLLIVYAREHGVDDLAPLVTEDQTQRLDRETGPNVQSVNDYVERFRTDAGSSVRYHSRAVENVGICQHDRCKYSDRTSIVVSTKPQSATHGQGFGRTGLISTKSRISTGWANATSVPR